MQKVLVSSSKKESLQATMLLSSMDARILTQLRQLEISLSEKLMILIFFMAQSMESSFLLTLQTTEKAPCPSLLWSEYWFINFLLTNQYIIKRPIIFLFYSTKSCSKLPEKRQEGRGGGVENINEMYGEWVQVINKFMIKKNTENREEEIKKKLSSIRDPRELKKLLASASTQNKKLVEDIRELRVRVDILMQKHKEQEEKVKQKSSGSEAKERELAQEQKQLKRKYKQMNKLKKQLEGYEEIEDVKNNKQKFLNEQANVEKKIKQYKKQMNDLVIVRKKLQNTFVDWEKEDNVNEPKIKELEAENKKLREDITEITKKGYVKQYQSIKVQSNLFTTKKKIRDNEIRKSMFDVRAQPVKNKRDVLAEYQTLKKQVKQLKQQVQTIEQNEEVQKYERNSIREQLKKESKDRVNTMRTLENRKSKAERQNNMMKKKWFDICKTQEKLRNKVKKVENQCQVTEFVDEDPLRKQYCGVIGRNRADDRLILKENKLTKIIGLTIYETERGLVGIQAHYDNDVASTLPFTNYFLAKCKVTKIATSQDDFFKLFKIKYNSLENKIIKFESRSNKNIRYQYGDKRAFNEIAEGDVVYGFDIRIHEYPVCMFSSYVFMKGNYHMQGLGVEINNLQ